MAVRFHAGDAAFAVARGDPVPLVRAACFAVGAVGKGLVALGLCLGRQSVRLPDRLREGGRFVVVGRTRLGCAWATDAP